MGKKLKEHRSKVRDVFKLAAEPGFEPGLEDPKSPVLPLHNSAILVMVPKVGFEPTRESPLNSF